MLINISIFYVDLKHCTFISAHFTAHFYRNCKWQTGLHPTLSILGSFILENINIIDPSTWQETRNKIKIFLINFILIFLPSSLLDPIHPHPCPNMLIFLCIGFFREGFKKNLELSRFSGWVGLKKSIFQI